MNRCPAAVAVAAACALVVGCAPTPELAAPAPGQPSSAAASPGALVLPDPSELTTAEPGEIDADTGEVIGPEPIPTWDQASREDVTATAVAAMTAWARPDVSGEQWLADLLPFLDPDAARDWAFTDPANIAAREVTGPGVIVEDFSAFAARVEVPTDAGPHVLILARADGASPWLLSRVIPPEGAG